MRLMRMIKPIIVVLILLGVVGSVGYYLFGTTSGSELVLRQGLKQVGEFGAYGYQSVEGSLLRTFTVSELVVKDIEGLAAGNECRVEQIKIMFPSVFKLAEPVVTCTNGRLRIPGSEDILFFGAFTQGVVDVQVSAPSLVFGSFRGLLDDSSAEFDQFDATVKDLQLHLTGPVDRIRASGNFLLRESSYRIFHLRDIPVSLDVTYIPKEDTGLATGYVSFSAGTFSGPKGAVLNIQPSRISFDGEPRDGLLQVAAQTRIDEYAIIANLEGTIRTPALSLSSEPPLSKEEIMLLLATGTSAKSLKDIIRDTIRSYK